MENDIQTLENVIRANLNPSICSDDIIFVINRENKNDNPHVKLYDNIDSACMENDNFTFYSLTNIIKYNINRALPFHNCLNRKSNVKGCVVSLKVYEGRTAFTKINRIEIISI